MHTSTMNQTVFSIHADRFFQGCACMHGKGEGECACATLEKLSGSRDYVHTPPHIVHIERNFKMYDL